MTRCVVDTNIVVYYLNQVGGDDFRRRFDEIVEKGAVISVITRIEVLSWPGYADVSPAMAVAEALLSILREEPRPIRSSRRPSSYAETIGSRCPTLSWRPLPKFSICL